MAKSTLLFVIIFVTAFNGVFAQATATFTASVTIIQPIGINTTSNMNFAHIDAQEGGAVVLNPDDSRISNGAVVLDEAALVSAAAFEITGEQGFAFSITLPQEEYVLSNGSEQMIIKDFTSDFTSDDRLAGGLTQVRVGATLDVNANQKPGVYNSTAPMNVTVNYN